MFEFKEPALVDQVAIHEGRYGRLGTVKKFSVYLRSDGEWKKVYSGTKIGSNCGIVLDEPVNADAMKVVFEDFDRHATINAVDAFSSFTAKSQKSE